MSRTSLSRRTFLRGAGALLALPTLEAMLDGNGEALASGEPLPRRLVIFFFGNGVVLNRYLPSGTGSGWVPSEALQPLAPVKDYVSVVSGYDLKTPDLRAHHNGACGILSGYPFISIPAGSANFSSKFGGPSIDQVAAARIGGATPYKSLQLGISKRAGPWEGPTLQYVSHAGPDAPLPPTVDPVKLFTQLFSNFTAGSTTDPRAALRASVLDAVREDAVRLRGRLGSADRARLDAHLTQVSELRAQLLALPPVVTSACAPPASEATRNVDVGGKEPFTAVSRAMFRLLTLALACDLTRVASIQFTGPVGDQVFSELGQVDNQHELTHDPARQRDVHDTVVFTFSRFAELLTQLRGAVEGTGNLLDQSAVLCTSDVSEGLYHSCTDYPLVVAGRAGGALTHPGVHLRGSRQNTSDVLLAVLRAVGADVGSVGGGAGLSSTPCAGLLA